MNLIPKKPDGVFHGNYFCTWCLQGGAEGMNEERMFGKEGLLSTYPDKNRKAELIAVFDDGWDVPYGTRNPEEIYRYGVGRPDPKRFPSTKGMKPAEALKWLVDKTKSYGFLGAGLWMPMQTSRKTDVMYDMDDYIRHWTKLAKWSEQAGVLYWKVDWGQHYWNNTEARENLTNIVRRHAPHLFIEHAHVIGTVDRELSEETRREREARENHVRRVLDVSDFYRTYDCGGITSVPTTLKRLATLMEQARYIHEDNGCRHIVNVEDDLYIGAAFGCSCGIMRHPVYRKENRLETERALNWERIMPPFPLKNDGNHLDDELITNAWEHDDKHIVRQSAPARLSRNCPLPEVSLGVGQYQPWVIAAVHPERKALGIYAPPRTVIGWQNCWSYADITVEAKSVTAPVGVFGSSYNTLTVIFPAPITGKHVMVQDLADTVAYDVTAEVQITETAVTFTRDQIPAFGARIKADGDESAPAFIMQLI